MRPCDSAHATLAWVGPAGRRTHRRGQPLRSGVLDSLFVAAAGATLRGAVAPSDRRHARAETALAELRARIAQAPALPSCWPGIDGKPVLLHVLHGWGGGVERFARDLADGDRQRSHLARWLRVASWTSLLRRGAGTGAAARRSPASARPA
ncbi:MAG: hypothetical protein IPH76_16765 [Xanthomonadales bacterium]|nr:hypothetical protein [Xanthomonadales bacterium]